MVGKNGKTIKISKNSMTKLQQSQNTISEQSMAISQRKGLT
jgi:hypothetical protein